MCLEVRIAIDKTYKVLNPFESMTSSIEKKTHLKTIIKSYLIGIKFEYNSMIDELDLHSKDIF